MFCDRSHRYYWEQLFIAYAYLRPGEICKVKTMSNTIYLNCFFLNFTSVSALELINIYRAHEFLITLKNPVFAPNSDNLSPMEYLEIKSKLLVSVDVFVKKSVDKYVIF